MPETQIGGLPVSGRKSAYVLRNRQGIIKAAQQVLAHQGSAASIEEIAAQAEVSVSTVYKHFSSKDDLITAAFQTAMQTWESWMKAQLADTADSLEKLVLPMCLFIRAKETHPIFAAMVAKNPSEATSRLKSLGETLTLDLQALQEAGVLRIEDVSLRGELLMAVLVHVSQKVYFDSIFTLENADGAIAIALGLLGVDPSTARSLVSSPISLIQIQS